MSAIQEEKRNTQVSISNVRKGISILDAQNSKRSSRQCNSSHPTHYRAYVKKIFINSTFIQSLFLRFPVNLKLLISEGSSIENNIRWCVGDKSRDICRNYLIVPIEEIRRAAGLGSLFSRQFTSHLHRRKGKKITRSRDYFPKTLQTRIAREIICVQLLLSCMKNIFDSLRDEQLMYLIYRYFSNRWKVSEKIQSLFIADTGTDI